MIVKFKVNLGSQDASPLGLDFADCTVGKSVACDEKAGKWLVAKGIAEDVTPPAKIEPAPAPAPVQGVEPKNQNKLKS